MISIEQCRAARGLLGWTQQELADIAGLSKTAINNFEKSHSDIKRDSLIAIQNALENAGVEFLDHDGIRKRMENVKIIRSPHIYSKLIQDIGQQAEAQSTGEVLIASYSAPEKEEQSLTDRQNIQKLSELSLKMRILCTGTVIEPSCAYRILGQEQFLQSGSFVVYGNKVAMQPWQKPIFVVVESQDISMAERQRFETLWSIAQEPDRLLSPDERKVGKA